MSVWRKINFGQFFGEPKEGLKFVPLNLLQH